MPWKCFESIKLWTPSQAAAWEREMFSENRQYIQVNNMCDLFPEVLIDITLHSLHVYELKCVYYKEEISFKEKQFEGSIKSVKLVWTVRCKNVGQNHIERWNKDGAAFKSVWKFVQN